MSCCWSGIDSLRARLGMLQGLIASAGLTNETALWAQRYSRDLYARLAAEGGQATGFRQTGYLQLASSRIRQQMLRREQLFAKSPGARQI